MIVRSNFGKEFAYYIPHKFVEANYHFLDKDTLSGASAKFFNYLIW